MNGKFCKAIIDTRAKINVITKDVQEKFDLPMRIRPDLKLVSHTSHKQKFLEVCKDIDIAIKDVVSCQNIFVVDNADHVLVLDTLFLIKARACMDWDTTGNLTITCQSPDASRTAITRVLRKDKQGIDLTEEELFPLFSTISEHLN